MGHDAAVTSSLRALTALLLAAALATGACSSDDGAEVGSVGTTDASAAAGSGGTTVDGSGDGGDAADLSFDECVEELFSLLDVDYDDAQAVSAMETALNDLGVVCDHHDTIELQTVLEERRDELSEDAQAFVFGEAQAPSVDAAGLPCVAPVEDLGVDVGGAELPTGAPPTELVVTDIVEGDGAEVTEGSTVRVDYVGYSCSTGEVFDSSYARGEPAEFPLDGVIEGWSQGLLGMAEGGKRLLVIPSDLGYGPAGSPPSIAGNETLVFVVEVQAVVS